MNTILLKYINIILLKYIYLNILLQVILGIIQALTSEKTSQLDLLISLEKLVLQNIAVSRDSTNVLGQVTIKFSSFSIF